MRRILVVVASLLCSLLVMAPGAAAKQRDLTLAQPVQVSATKVRLAGRAPEAHRTVQLQRRVNGTWVKVARVRVVDGRYRSRVTRGSAPQLYRTVAGRLRSPVRTVPARPVLVDSGAADPTSASDPAPAPAPAPKPVKPAPTLDACGTALLRADGRRRTCTFADDFNGTQLDRTKWVPQTNFVSGDVTQACYRDHPDNISVSGGALRLTVREESAPLACAHPGTAPTRFTAGSVMTYHLFSQVYGRFEARIKSEASGPGLQEAFWLWPDDRQSIPVSWPAAGEIDIVETYSMYPNLAIPFLHYTYNDNGGPIPGTNTAWDCAAARGVWNTYTLEWTATRLEIMVNGRTCLVNTTGDSAFQRKYIMALTALLGVQGNGYVAGTTKIPATMSVDYVRVWE